MIDFDAFAGRDRLEQVPAFGRVFRMGSVDALVASDPEKIRELLRQAGSVNEAREYLSYIHGLNTFMLELIFEWVLRWPVVIDQLIGAKLRMQCIQLAYKTWCAANEKWDGPDVQSAYEEMRGLFSADRLNPEALTEFEDTKRTSRQPSHVCVVPQKAFDELLGKIELYSAEEKELRFNSYLSDCRARHDGILRMSWCLGSAVLNLSGQAVSEEALRRSLQSCSSYNVLFDLAKELSPRSMAAFLAEHLRSHFSGPGREGSVQVIEEPNCYRIIIDACGSGGAMRRLHGDRSVGGLEKLPEASPCTWGRAGEVPVYCAHCAQNEIASIARIGYPVMVTEFTPDPARPCGWTIYKSPDLVPEMYFSRLGVTKDPAKFYRRNE